MRADAVAHLVDLRSSLRQTSRNRYECSVASLQDYERKRDPRRTPEPFGRAGAARRRSSSSSATTPAGSTTTSGSSATARSPAGRSPRACRSSRARSISPSTSRITRSPTRHSRARSRQGNYGAGTVEIWDRGTYELVEEKPNGGLTVHLHGERLKGPWTLVPAKLGGDPKNWLLVKKKTDAAPPRQRAVATRRCSRRSPTRCRPATAGCYEVKWDGYRAIATIARRGRRADAAATASR